jgi:HSP20 family protein
MTDGEDNVRRTSEAPRRRFGLSDLRDESERIMETLLSPWRPFHALAHELTGPPLDIYEEGGQLHIQVELPGVEEHDVEVRASEHILTVRGEKSRRQPAQEHEYHRSERSYGRFVRHVPLPAGAAVEQATAGFKAGVLEINIPLAGEPGTKRIEIRPAGDV